MRSAATALRALCRLPPCDFSVASGVVDPSALEHCAALPRNVNMLHVVLVLTLQCAKQYLKKHGESAALLEDPSWVSTKADKGKILYRAYLALPRTLTLLCSAQCIVMLNAVCAFVCFSRGGARRLGSRSRSYLHGSLVPAPWIQRGAPGHVWHAHQSLLHLQPLQG